MYKNVSRANGESKMNLSHLVTSMVPLWTDGTAKVAKKEDFILATTSL